MSILLAWNSWGGETLRAETPSPKPPNLSPCFVRYYAGGKKQTCTAPTTDQGRHELGRPQEEEGAAPGITPGPWRAFESNEGALGAVGNSVLMWCFENLRHNLCFDSSQTSVRPHLKTPVELFRPLEVMHGLGTRRCRGAGVVVGGVGVRVGVGFQIQGLPACGKVHIMAVLFLFFHQNHVN